MAEQMKFCRALSTQFETDLNCMFCWKTTEIQKYDKQKDGQIIQRPFLYLPNLDGGGQNILREKISQNVHADNQSDFLHKPQT